MMCSMQLAKGGSAGLVSWVQTIVLADTPAAGGKLAVRRLQASSNGMQDAGAPFVALHGCCMSTGRPCPSQRQCIWSLQPVHVYTCDAAARGQLTGPLQHEASSASTWMEQDLQVAACLHVAPLRSMCTQHHWCDCRRPGLGS